MASSAVISVYAAGPIESLQLLIQNNVIGPPAVHQITEWNFDPYVTVERRELFRREHGFRGEKLTERLGLGVDGNHEARLALQRARDEGLLGGTIIEFKSRLNTLGPIET